MSTRALMQFLTTPFATTLASFSLTDHDTWSSVFHQFHFIDLKFAVAQPLSIPVYTSLFFLQAGRLAFQDTFSDHARHRCRQCTPTLFQASPAAQRQLRYPRPG